MRDKKGRILKGSSSLSPNGSRPKKMQSIARLIKDNTNDIDDCILVYVSIMKDTKASNSDRIKASTCLIEYAYGKPSQHIDLDTNVIDIVIKKPENSDSK